MHGDELQKECLSLRVSSILSDPRNILPIISNVLHNSMNCAFAGVWHVEYVRSAGEVRAYGTCHTTVCHVAYGI